MTPRPAVEELWKSLRDSHSYHSTTTAGFKTGEDGSPGSACPNLGGSVWVALDTGC